MLLLLPFDTLLAPTHMVIRALGIFLFFCFLECVSVLGSHYLYTSRIGSVIDFSCFFNWITFSRRFKRINNMRDRVNDKQYGKTTIAVRLGAEKAAMFYQTDTCWYSLLF